MHTVTLSLLAHSLVAIAPLVGELPNFTPAVNLG